MAARQIVSYDDLYSDNEVEEATGGDAKTGAAASSTPEIHGDQQSASSCTSASEAEDEDDPSNILARPGAWDDSELIRAWDSAIDDYRKHHSSMLNDDEQRTEFHKHESKVGGWTPVLEEGSGSGQPGRKRRRGAEEQSRAASEKCTDVENSGYVHEQASWAGAAGAAGAQELGDSWAMNPAPPTSGKKRCRVPRHLRLDHAARVLTFCDLLKPCNPLFFCRKGRAAQAQHVVVLRRVLRRLLPGKMLC
ncbi:hypothetical protein GQ54DRAFT_295361 [Martensiomyces pterosporus]|nr:hypothetical protein GQ54DRAFT_295361 [Martensiomyces pterosporus]